MNSNRAPGATGSSKGPAPSTAPSLSAGRSPSNSRRSTTPTRDVGRGAVSPYLASSSARTGGHGSSSTRLCHAAAASAAAVDGDSSPELVAQLQERLQQLESEFKVSQEAAQWTIKHNKNTLVSLKHENKELSAEVARRGGSTELQCKQGSATDSERVVERLERQVHELRRAYDKVVKDKKTALQKLDNLHDSLRDMAKVAAAAPAAAAAAAAAAVPSLPLSASLSSAASVYAVAAAAATAAPAAPADSATARELRQLQNRLDKATAKANEAFSIRKTYEQVLEKLRKEEPLLESRIRGLEEQKAMKRTALQAAVLAGREVAAAKESVKAALTALEADVEANRARRARVLAEMREKASTLQQTNRALMQRQFMPLTAATPSQPASEAGDTLHEADVRSADTVRHVGTPRPPAPPASSPSAAPPAAPAADDLESGPSHAPDEQDDITARDLVIRLCRATNVQRVSELVARLLAQQESYARLVDMRAQATAQRLALTQELEVLRTHRDDLRRGGKLSTQKQMDAAQGELADTTARCDAAQDVLESLLRGHADVRAGLEHLAALVGPLPMPPGGQPVVPVEDETLGDVLGQIEQRLSGAYKLISALPRALEALESQYAALRQVT